VATGWSHRIGTSRQTGRPPAVSRHPQSTRTHVEDPL
jgi:hypothetical protein